MGRRKIEIKKIENLKARQVCFTKRRKGLFKKAAELSRLVNDVDFLSIVFSPSGTPFTFSTFNDPSSSSSPIDPILDLCVQQPLNSDSRTEIKKKKSLLEINLGDLPENQLESVIKAFQTMKLNVLKRLHEIRNTKDDEFDWLGLMNQQVSATIDLENTSTDHQLLLSNGAENTTIDDQGTDFDEDLLNFDFSFFAQDSTSSATEKQIPAPCLELSATSDYDSVLIDNSELFSLVHDSYPPSRITTDHQSDLGINRWWWRC